MSRSSTKQVLRAWIALAAFVFSLFAPSLSHAFATPQQATHEICTAAGIVMMPVAGEAGDDAGAMAGMAHCDICCSHHAPTMLPAPPHLPLLDVSTRDTYPRLFHQSPSPQFAWTPSQSRAPPAGFF
ncbi:MAG: DUF2946 domain-containing protein [Lysobacteraceae bacterium]|nr:MAG: DUF2946 domain-containing protein [Xanthomonadaceae bacterium]